MRTIYVRYKKALSLRAFHLLPRHNPAEVSWDAYTEMRQLDGNIVWRDQVISLNSFNAGVSQLLLESTGRINLASDKYKFTD